jgi:hypothetical protein
VINKAESLNFGEGALPIRPEFAANCLFRTLLARCGRGK